MIRSALDHVSRVTWIILGISVLLFAFFMWFFTHFDKIAYEKNLGYASEARRNPYLAAEMYLKQQSVDLERRHDFSLFAESPGQYDTIFIGGSRIGMGTVQREKMRDWLEQGGHLVLLATEFWEYDFNTSRDSFLDQFGLRYYPDSEEDYSESESDELMRLEFSGYSEETEVEFFPSGYLEDTSGEAAFTAGTEEADQLIQYSVGEGLLTVLVDFSIWKNDRIEKHDHAMLLHQLIGNSPRAWLVYNRVQPSLFNLMLTETPLILLSAVVLLLGLLFGALWRKGPQREDTPPVQREIMQHIAAAGEFAYRVDHGRDLINALRFSLESRLGQLVPGYSRLTIEQQIYKLAQLTGFDSDRLIALWPDEAPHDFRNQDTFVTTVQLIQEIRKHL